MVELVTLYGGGGITIFYLSRVKSRILMEFRNLGVFEALTKINGNVRARLKAGNGPLFLPHSFQAPANARELIADEMTRLFHNTVRVVDVPRSGVLCVDESLIPKLKNLPMRKLNSKRLYVICEVKIRNTITMSRKL